MKPCFVRMVGLLALSGCVSNSETFTQDGKKGHVINCTPGWTGGIVGSIANASTSWAQCYQRAGELCGAQGYTVLQQSGEAGVRADVSRGAGSMSTTNNRSMIVQCK